jgi:hypothetical protein
MEYDVLAVLPALAEEDPESSAERLLAAFVATHPETGPVASVDLERNTFDVAFTVEASEAYEAIEIAKGVFLRAAHTANLEVRPLDAFHVDAAASDRVSEFPLERQRAANLSAAR